MKNLIIWFIFFIAYSFAGWIYESILCSFLEKKPVNRGFLTGPICPVYGFGTVAVLLVLGNVKNATAVFFGGMIITCAIEYATALILEKLFNAKWWDYSQHRFNIKGRVCLFGALIFGLLSVVIVKFAHPAVGAFVYSRPDITLYIIAAISLAALLSDIALTVRHLLLLDGRLYEIQTAFNHFVKIYAGRAGVLKDALLEKFEESEYFTERIRCLFSLNRFQNIRLMRAFPRLRPLSYTEAWQKLRCFLLGKDKKD